MNQTVPPARSRTLVVIAGLMVATLLGLLVAAALSLNQTSHVAMFEGYAVDGTRLWSVETDIDDGPVFSAGEVSFPVRGRATGITAAGTIVARTDLGTGPTGSLVHPTAITGEWVEVPHDGAAQASVAAMVEVLVTTSARYLRHGGGIVAVAAGDGEVLWSDPDRVPIAAADRVALFRNSKRFILASATTGETIATVSRTKRSTAVLGDRNLLVVNNGRIIVVDEYGTRSRLATVGSNFRAKAVSDRYAVVVAPIADEWKRRVQVFDIETGQRLLATRLAPSARMGFDGDKLLLCNGVRPAPAIDLAAGSDVRPSESSCVPKPARARPLVAVFDPSRQRLLWEHQIGPLSTFGIVGDTIVFVRAGTKRDGKTSYDGR